MAGPKAPETTGVCATLPVLIEDGAASAFCFWRWGPDTGHYRLLQQKFQLAKSLFTLSFFHTVTQLIWKGSQRFYGMDSWVLHALDFSSLSLGFKYESGLCPESLFFPNPTSLLLMGSRFF